MSSSDTGKVEGPFSNGELSFSLVDQIDQILQNLRQVFFVNSIDIFEVIFLHFFLNIDDHDTDEDGGSRPI